MKPSVNNRDFVSAWIDAVNRGAGLQGVASKLNMTSKAASMKATILRSRGVQLPKMSRNMDDNSVEALNALIERKLVRNQ